VRTDKQNRLRILGAVTVVVIGVIAATMWMSASDGATKKAAAPAKPSVSGYVYYDRNDNGVQDAGEPGIAGIRVRDKSGGASTLTSATGAYAFSSVPTSGYLQVETGWFRSQCPPVSAPTGTSCPAGPGADNAYLVNNQFVQYTLNGTSTTHADVGLVPDWPGRSMTIPAPVDGVVPANPVDVAARLSWGSGTCAGGAYEICRAGDTFTLIGQVFNQGTGDLTGIHARVYVPPGDCVKSATVLGYSAPAGLGALTTSPAAPTCATRYLELSFAGDLVPAGGVRVAITGSTATGPGTPGCTLKKTNAKLCPTAEPQGRGWLIGVSHIDQSGDPDSTFCAGGDMTLCPIGLHDKRRAPDEIDPAGHNVDAALGGSTAYDLAAHAQMADATTVRAWASNSGPNTSGTKVTVKIWLPAGTAVLGVPAKHTLISCDNGKTSGSAVVVTCVLGGPIAPTLSSPASDITLGTAPARVVVCVAPPSGAPAETVPASSGCDLDTTSAETTTNNDATLTTG
jgi:SdrD B-like domain